MRHAYLKVGVVGINFKSAPLRLREEVAKIAQLFADERGRFFPYPTVLLSTCNRTEVYFSSDDLAEAHSHLLSLLRGQSDMPFEPYLYSYFGIDCFAHLCQVAAGLDSAIVAEAEIQGQVRRAYARAQELCSLPSCLHYLFQKGLKVGKWVRRDGPFEEGAMSLERELWDIGLEMWGSWEGRRVLLIGYSEIQRRWLSFLKRKGESEVTLVTRSPEKIEEGIEVVGREGIKRWREYEVVVSATHSSDYLIGGEGKGQLLFDLSVPRTIDPKVKGVHLYNIEQLHQRIEAKRASHAEEIEAWKREIAYQVARLTQLYVLKTRRAQDSEGRGSRLECSPSL